MTSRTIFPFFLLLTWGLNAQTFYYVSQSAGGQNNGQSWTDAYNDLQSALQLAQPGDEIRVAAGIYFPGPDRFSSFELPSGVRLVGGFAGSDNDPEQRDWQAYPSVLDGDTGTAGDSSDNVYNVLYLFEPDSNTLVDGFLIRHGNADSSSAPDPRSRFRCGGGLYMMAADADAYAEIRNCTFRDNNAFSSGAGCMVNGAGLSSVAPRFRNCLFENNHAGANGGGLARFGGSVVERGADFEGCIFLKNRAEHRGGGLYYVDGPGIDRFDIKNCTFLGNDGVKSGGGAFLIMGRTSGGMGSIVGCLFKENIAPEGAPFRVAVPGIGMESVRNFQVKNCQIVENVCLPPNDGVCIYIELFSIPGSKIDFTNNYISQNFNWYCVLRAELESFFYPYTLGYFNMYNDTIINNHITNKTIHLASSRVSKLKNVLISNNTGTNVFLIYQGGATKRYFLQDMIVIGNQGGGNNVQSLYISGSNLDTTEITNCLIYDNEIINQKDQHVNARIMTVSNSYINKAKLKSFFTAAVSSTITNCAFDLDCAALSANGITCGPGILSGILNPMLRDTAAGDYGLLPCSPLIDAGSNTAVADIPTDFTGAPRIQGGTVDIGAVESAGPGLAFPALVQPACTGSAGGSISLTPSNGCAPYTYAWDPPAGSGPVLNGLPPGVYSCTVSDSRSRSFSETFTVAAVDGPQLEGIAVDVPCGTLTGGTASVAVAGGTAPFGFLWHTGATDSVLTMQAAGLYRVTVTDANGCVDSTELSISLQNQLTLMVNGGAISCFGQSDGWLSAAAVNGKAPFSYQWSQGSQDSLLTGLGSGDYSVTVTDFYGCTASFEFHLTEPQALQIIASATPSGNMQLPNGSADVSAVAGGTPAYMYAWSNGGTTQTIDGLPPGIYTVTVTDAMGCTVSSSVEVTFMSGTSAPNDLTVRVWPNPMREKLQIEATQNSAQPLRLVLHDDLGRPVAATMLKSGYGTLDVSALPAGSYQWLLFMEERVVGSGWVLK